MKKSKHKNRFFFLCDVGCFSPKMRFLNLKKYTPPALLNINERLIGCLYIIN